MVRAGDGNSDEHQGDAVCHQQWHSGFQKHAENKKYGDHTSAVNFAQVNHAAVAQACGCLGIRVTEPDELQQAIKQAKASDKTVLIEVICDQNAFPPLTFYSAE